MRTGVRLDVCAHGAAEPAPVAAARERQLERLGLLHAREPRRLDYPYEPGHVRGPPDERIDTVEDRQRLLLVLLEARDHVHDNGALRADAADVLDGRDRVLQVQKEVAAEDEV